MSRARELLRSVKNLSIIREMAATDGGLQSVGDWVDNFIDSEAMAICVERFEALPEVRTWSSSAIPLPARPFCAGVLQKEA